MSRPRMSGTALQDSIAEAAQYQGWRVAHFRNARTKDGQHRTPVAYDGKGYPDLTLVRDRIVFAEIKGDGDTVSYDQQAWLEALEAAGAEAYVWRPKHWLSGEVDEILGRRGGGS